MLKKILSHEKCAECRLCCVFDRYDLWETPIVNNALKEKILKTVPETEFTAKGGAWIFKMNEERSSGLYYCPMLTETGCILGDEKPFDCSVWPFRVMLCENRRCIAVAPICDAVSALSMKTLLDFLKEGLAEKMFAYADENPDAVKPYDESYPILMFEREKVV